MKRADSPPGACVEILLTGVFHTGLHKMSVPIIRYLGKLIVSRCLVQAAFVR